MRLRLCLLAALVVCPSLARADGPWTLFDGCRWCFPGLREQWQKRRCWCPDDYRGKCLPAVPCNGKGCVDDYCGKTMPCVTPNTSGCVDDYCRKKCPIQLGCPSQPWYTCGTPAPQCPPCPPRPPKK